MYSERVLLSYYFPWALGIIAGDAEMAAQSTVMDIAGGCGHFLLALSKNLPFVQSAHLVDASPGCVRSAQDLFSKSSTELTASLDDMHSLPYGNSSIGLVICHDSLHHSPDPRSALRELLRIAASRVFVADLSPDATETAISKHLSCVNECFPDEVASAIRHRFLESVEVAYPFEDVISWIECEGGKVLSVRHRQLGYAIIAEKRL